MRTAIISSLLCDAYRHLSCISLVRCLRCLRCLHACNAYRYLSCHFAMHTLPLTREHSCAGHDRTLQHLKSRDVNYFVSGVCVCLSVCLCVCECPCLLVCLCVCGQLSLQERARDDGAWLWMRVDTWARACVTARACVLCQVHWHVHASCACGMCACVMRPGYCACVRSVWVQLLRVQARHLMSNEARHLMSNPSLHHHIRVWVV